MIVSRLGRREHEASKLQCRKEAKQRAEDSYLWVGSADGVPLFIIRTSGYRRAAAAIDQIPEELRCPKGHGEEETRDSGHTNADACDQIERYWLLHGLTSED